jgi:hypothetical protein
MRSAPPRRSRGGRRRRRGTTRPGPARAPHISSRGLPPPSSWSSDPRPGRLRRGRRRAAPTSWSTRPARRRRPRLSDERQRHDLRTYTDPRGALRSRRRRQRRQIVMVGAPGAHDLAGTACSSTAAAGPALADGAPGDDSSTRSRWMPRRFVGAPGDVANTGRVVVFDAASGERLRPAPRRWPRRSIRSRDRVTGDTVLIGAPGVGGGAGAVYRFAPGTTAGGTLRKPQPTTGAFGARRHERPSSRGRARRRRRRDRWWRGILHRRPRRRLPSPPAARRIRLRGGGQRRHRRRRRAARHRRHRRDLRPRRVVTPP